MPNQPKSPGQDFSAALRGGNPDWKNVSYYEMETTRAVRTERWKYVALVPKGPYELYDMQTDPQERFNLVGQPDMESKISELAKKLDTFFATYADPLYDIWKGGRSKAKRHSP